MGHKSWGSILLTDLIFDRVGGKKQYQFRMKALANELPGVKKASW